MAEQDDKSLDDFFAKKDKSKKKDKSRITPDDIEYQMEKKLKKKSAARKKDKDSSNSTQSSVLSVKIEEDDGEWKDVEEETEKDYSNLRIQNLKISSKEEEERDRQDNGQSGEEGDDRNNREGCQGPWKSIPSSAAAIYEPSATTEKTSHFESESKEAPKTSGKYIPPGLRKAQLQGPSGTITMAGGPGGRRKKIAPNFNSQDDFPSLAAASMDQGENPGHDFEKVKGGGRQIEDPTNQTVKLSLGNKFGALEGKDS